MHADDEVNATKKRKVSDISGEPTAVEVQVSSQNADPWLAEKALRIVIDSNYFQFKDSLNLRGASKYIKNSIDRNFFFKKAVFYQVLRNGRIADFDTGAVEFIKKFPALYRAIIFKDKNLLIEYLKEFFVMMLNNVVDDPTIVCRLVEISTEMNLMPEDFTSLGDEVVTLCRFLTQPIKDSSEKNENITLASISGLIERGYTEKQRKDMETSIRETFRFLKLEINSAEQLLVYKNLSCANLGDAVFYQASFLGANLSGANLGDAVFYDVSFLGANLSGLNLGGASFYEISFLGANLSGANLGDAVFGEVSFLGENLSGANLTRANLKNSVLSGANLSGANLGEAVFDEVSFLGANLSRTNLNFARLSKVDLAGANLSDANINMVCFSKANLVGANLSGADLRAADLYEADLYGANLSGAKLRGASLVKANLTVVCLSGANLSGAKLRKASFVKANLTLANLEGANLSRANLNEANLSGADLSGADLRGAILKKANLVTASFVGADFEGADLSEVNFFTESTVKDFFCRVEESIKLNACGILPLLFAILKKEPREIGSEYVARLKTLTQECLQRVLEKMTSVEKLNEFFYKVSIEGNVFFTERYPRVLELIANTYVSRNLSCRVAEVENNFRKKLVEEISKQKNSQRFYKDGWSELLNKIYKAELKSRQSFNSRPRMNQM